MAEIGLVDFAKFALAIAKRVLPLYRSKYSKHTFTQPQLLAILCMMGYEVHHMKRIIPPKRGKKTWNLKGVRAKMESNFPSKKCC